MHVCIVLKGSFCNENVTKYFFSVYFAWNETLTKFQIFHQNHGPLEKCQFCGFLNRRFHCPERLVCYIKCRKSFFHDLFSWSITWEYREVRRGYRGWQGVTKGDRGLQGVTGGYKGLRGVARGYRGLQGVTGVTWGDRRLQRMSETFF